jgi:hypothetical protein
MSTFTPPSSPNPGLEISDIVSDIIDHIPTNSAELHDPERFTYITRKLCVLGITVVISTLSIILIKNI